MKKLLVLGGGENQVPIMVRAKELGYYVVLCDYLKDNPGKAYSDVHYLVSTYDYDAVKQVAIKEKIDGVVTNSEPVLHIMVKLTDELNLPSIGERVIKLFLNKNLMRDHLASVNLNTVKYQFCTNKDEAISFFNRYSTKMIMKPVDCSASRGVHSINSTSDIDKYFDECTNSNRRKNSVLIEEYIEGKEFTVDGICINGKHRTLGISKKNHFEYNENVANELYFSYLDEKYDYDYLRIYNDKIAESTGLPFGMTHSEYKILNGKFHFIEMSARGGGNFISTMIIPFISGVDTISLLIKTSLGDEDFFESDAEENAHNRCAILKFFSTTNDSEGIVKEISGRNYLDNCSNVLKYDFKFKIGDRIKRAENDSERLGYFIAVAENRQELDSVINEINKRVKIIFYE